MKKQQKIELYSVFTLTPGADPGFQVGGVAHLKKLRRAEGGANIVGVFRVKNHDFTPKNNIFSILWGGGCAPLDPSLGHQFRNLLTLIVENFVIFEIFLNTFLTVLYS